MLTLTSPHKTWAHDMPAGGKLIALALATMALFSITSPMILALCAAGTAALIASGKGQFVRAAAAPIRALWPFVVIVAAWHLWLRDPSGIAIILRMVTAVSLANFVTMTTRLSDMMAVLEAVMRPLSRVLPPRRFALAVALVIRFVPTMLTRADDIALAWRARSARRPQWRVFLPLTLSALDDADRTAEALRARGGTD
jgi:biotin transport system permease protein